MMETDRIAEQNRIALGRLKFGCASTTACKLPLRLLASAFHDFINPVLANLFPKQIKHSFLRSLLAHMLFLSAVHHGCFQPRFKPASHFQPARGLRQLFPPATRAASFILAHFDHLRFRQFLNLIDFDQLPLLPFQPCLTVLVSLCSHFDNIVGICC